MAAQSMRQAEPASRPSARPSLAGGAGQGLHPTVGLCMIVRDEAEDLPRCLASVLGLVDEIIVVDTGSRDDTVAIAQRFSAQVFVFAWCDDFAAARNFSLEQVTTDWVLYLDADEALEAKRGPNLRRLVALPHERPRAILLPIRNYLGESGQGPVVQHYAARLFSRHPRVRFHRPIHEDLTHLDGPDRLERLVSDDLVVDHFGYRQSIIRAREKEARNLSALERAVAAGSADPYDHYLLARERYAFGKLAAAVEALSTMFRLLPNEDPGYVGEGYAILVAALIGLGRADEAVAAAQRGIRTHPYTDLWYNAGNAYLQLGDASAAVAAYRQALARRSNVRPYTRDLSIGAWRAWLGLGEACRRQGDLASAGTALAEALQAAPLEREVVITAAVVACLRGRAAEAIAAIERYLAAHPDDELLRQLLADAGREGLRGSEDDPCRR